MNADPAFQTGYHIKLNSAAKDLGDAATVVQTPQIPFDLDNMNRLLDSGPDAGCYEYQP